MLQTLTYWPEAADDPVFLSMPATAGLFNGPEPEGEDPDRRPADPDEDDIEDEDGSGDDQD